MTSERQESTMADYLRMLRQRRLLIAVTVLTCAAAALGVSLLQRPSYSAEASVSVRDPNQDVSLLGGAGTSINTPEQIAAAHVPQVTRPLVVQRVQAELRGSFTVSQLSQSVDVHVDPSSDLVLIDSHAQRAADAAAIANAFATGDARESTTEARQAFATAASHLAVKIRSVARNTTTRLIYIDQLSRLQSLSAVAAPVVVSSTAKVPSAPSSPRPVVNTFVAALLGLLLGIVLASARNAVDRRLRHPDEVEEYVGLPLLGNVRKEALGHAGLISNGRGPTADVDLEGFRILRQNVEYLGADDEARCIVVTSAMAGEGKSTVAAGLALASAAAGKNTLLLECDLRRPVLAGRMDLARTPGLTDYLTGHASPQEILQLVPVAETAGAGAFTDKKLGTYVSATGEDCQLVCITAGELPSRPAELLASARFRDLLTDVREAYDVVILDSSPLLPVADTLELVPHVSGVLVCVRCDQTTRDQARGAKSCLDRLPMKPAGAVATGLRRGKGYYGYYDAQYDSSKRAPV